MRGSLDTPIAAPPVPDDVPDLKDNVLRARAILKNYPDLERMRNIGDDLGEATQEAVDFVKKMAKVALRGEARCNHCNSPYPDEDAIRISVPGVARSASFCTPVCGANSLMLSPIKKAG